MTARSYDGAAALASLAGRLGGPRPRGLPALFALTDPARTPDPVRLARALPAGAGLILRTFGEADIEAKAFELAETCRDRGVALLIAADPALARACGADGVHWPERDLRRAFRPWPGAIVTASAHGPSAIRRAGRIADAVFVSAVFASNSPSAGRPIGPFRLAAYATRSSAPVYALGGVNTRTVRRLERLGISGVGAIAAIRGTREDADA
ncbi:MAG: thiamine phosphate synthase [Oceanicaulis sp.]